MRKCRICGNKTKDVFSLGNLYLSNFTKEGTVPESPRGDLSLVFCDKCRLLQLETVTSQIMLYGRYWYRSGINSSMKMALADIVRATKELISIDKSDVWLDIACNDGTLLSFVGPECVRIGIDPADDTYRNESVQHADNIIQGYFNLENYRKATDRKAKVVSCIAMFYDLDDPHSFLKDVYEVMAEDGLFIVQLSYTPLMVQQVAFDNICHEHICYYSLSSLKYLFSMNGFSIVDCELNPVNGGSIRIYATKTTYSDRFKNGPYRDVANLRMSSLLKFEEDGGFNSTTAYKNFYYSILSLKSELTEFIHKEIKKGKKIFGYGSSTKGNTLLQYFGLDHNVITAIAERSPAKFGLKTVGTDIPIISEEEMRKQHPDYLLILPWHFVEDFKQRESEYLRTGGKFIIPCPDFKIIGY